VHERLAGREEVESQAEPRSRRIAMVGGHETSATHLGRTRLLSYTSPVPDLGGSVGFVAGPHSWYLPTVLYERFLDICRTFNDEGVDYLVVGAAALSLHGIPRGTQDLDFFVRPTAENFERIRRALSRIWNDPEIREITHEPPAVIRYGTPDGFVIDLILQLGEAFRFEDLEQEIIDVDGIPIHAASARTLYAMKKDTVRPQDRADADRLRRKFKLE